MRLLSYIVSFLKGFVFGATVAWVISTVAAIAVTYGVYRTAATLAVAAFIWRKRVMLARVFVVYPVCAVLRAYHWVCAPVRVVTSLTHGVSS